MAFPQLWGMEPDVKKFFVTIVQTMSMVLLWLLVNILVGLKLGLLFMERPFGLWHIVYYLWVVGTLIWVIKYVRKKWREAPVINPDEAE